MEKPSRSSYRIFWNTFFITLLCLGVVFALFYFITMRPAKEVTQNQVSVPVEGPSYTPAASDSQNILVIGCEEREKDAVFFLLLRFDAQDNCCYVVPLPPEAESTVNVKTMSLGEHYRYGGHEYALSGAENLFLIHIQKYIRMDQNSIASMVDFFGGMELDLSRGIDTKNYHFDAAKQQIDGSRAAELLLLGDTSLNSAVTCNFINQCLTEDLTDNRQDFYSILFNECDTGFTSLDLSNLAMPIKLFLNKTEDKAVPIEIDGEYTENGTRFLPSEAAIADIQEIFS
ncbi:LCP family protein [Massilimaliae timonensis]|uniref:LCP family protein n=1 Tax=Massiliimalia timonensis TaxID=1987501 RepID=A0A8J6TX28_9FIRM|nr:LCP family protein [Massiliimalia timonensis]MBC8610540.1 LCP family protein [Massiliimalia timonensis]